MAYARRRDGNEADLVAFMQQYGATVSRLEPVGDDAGLPDLAIGYCGETGLAEVKTLEGRLSKDQKTWHRTWRGSDVWVLRSIEDCIAMLEELAYRAEQRQEAA